MNSTKYLKVNSALAILLASPMQKEVLDILEPAQQLQLTANKKVKPHVQKLQPKSSQEVRDWNAAVVQKRLDRAIRRSAAKG